MVLEAKSTSYFSASQGTLTINKIAQDPLNIKIADSRGSVPGHYVSKMVLSTWTGPGYSTNRMTFLVDFSRKDSTIILRSVPSAWKFSMNKVWSLCYHATHVTIFIRSVCRRLRGIRRRVPSAGKSSTWMKSSALIRG